MLTAVRKTTFIVLNLCFYGTKYVEEKMMNKTKIGGIPSAFFGFSIGFCFVNHLAHTSIHFPKRKRRKEEEKVTFELSEAEFDGVKGEND